MFKVKTKMTEITRGMLPPELVEVETGLDTNADFSQAMVTALAEQEFSKREMWGEVPNAAERVVATLSDHEVLRDLDPRAAPTASSLARLTEDDWGDIEASEDPFLTLWSKANRRRLEDDFADNQYIRPPTRSFGPNTAYGHFLDQARARALPLLHGTTLTGITASMGSGELISNRAVYDRGGDPSSGATYKSDRELGFDAFVFADYGRPHSFRRYEQPEVVVVLEPEAMDVPGAFVTDHDFMHTDMFKPDGTHDYRKYMGEALEPEDFRATLLPALYAKRSAKEIPGKPGIWKDQTLSDFAKGVDSTVDQFGNAHFSTWEVKVPRVDQSHIRRLIFRDEAQMREFQEQFGDGIDCVHEPDLANNPQVLGTEARANREADALAAADYKRRSALIATASPKEKTYKYMLLGGLTSAGVTDPTHLPPEWFQQDPSTYPSAEEALAAATEGYRRAESRRPIGNFPRITNANLQVARVVGAKGVHIIEDFETHNIEPPERRSHDQEPDLIKLLMS